MKILSVNTGKAEVLQGGKKDEDPYLTGIYKRPVSGRIAVTKDGLTGDHIGDLNYHGGVDQAVYLYGWSDYVWWESSIGRSLEPGMFGENLTFSSLENDRLCIGDRFRIGSVILEVTSPRIPCAILSRRMEDSTFLRKFRKAERPGPYCRVIQEGEVGVEDPVTYEPCSGNRITLLEIFRAEFAPPKDAGVLRSHLAAPLAIRIRAAKEQLLAKVEATAGS